MLSRMRLAVALLGLAATVSPTAAGELEGRGRTWNFEVNVGEAIIDAGFDEEVFGYTIGSSFSVPPIDPDKLESEVPALGVRVGYNFTRFFGVEISGLTGETTVGTNHSVTLEPNLEIQNNEARNRTLREQTAVAPLMEDILNDIDYDYYGGSLVGVFSFNNRPTSRWTFYFTVGGGGYSLDTDTESFNDCSETTFITDPSVPVYNNFPGPVDAEPPLPRDRLPDNPQQIRRFVQNCDRSFPIARERVVVQGQPAQIVFGQPLFRNATAVLLDPSDPNFSPYVTAEGGLCDDFATCDGTIQFIVPPGTVQDSSLRQFNKIRSISSAYWTAGGGFRYWLRPRQSIRTDLRRHWDESINKNINEVMIGYSFTVGRGRDIRNAGIAPPPPDDDADGDGISDTDEVPPEPAGDDPPAL